MSSDSGSGPPIPGLLLVTLILGTVFLAESPLQGSRPREPARTNDLSSSEQVIPARLWQDPFEAIVLNRSSGKPANEPLPTQCDSDLKKIFRHSETDKGFGALLVMTPGSPYVEDGERRIRARYAVISALGVAGLSPRDSQHLGCARPAAGGGFDMPFEWFDPPGKGMESLDEQTEPSVLVAWLPEERFSHTPLKGLNDVVSQLRSAAGREVSVAVVGPHQSGTLNTMRMELLKIKSNNELPQMQHVRFYSPSATMDEKLLLQEQKCPRGAVTKDKCKTFSELYEHKVYKGSGDGFIRTILSDSDVSRALVQELQFRGVEFDPNKRNWVNTGWFNLTESLFKNYTNCEIFHEHRDHVVLISELDTLYGRRLPKAFIQAASSHDVHSEDPYNQNKLQWIHRFNYLRGLDGQFPEKIPGRTTTATQAQRKISSGQGGKEVRSRIKRAEGTPRFDYLRRLAHRVERLDGNLRKHYCGSIKAIGVLGSDVYDKLLILQALREKFPNTLFFTVDMDDRYLHPAEFKWTRNLIVASSHGQEPDLAFETDIPPFRDSYQTSSFLATLLAVSRTYPTQQDIDSGLSLHVYEIGRKTANELPHIEDPPTEEKDPSSGSVQVSWFNKIAQPNPHANQPDSKGPDAEFASAEVIRSFLQVRDVRPESPFSHLQSHNYPGRFIVIGSGLAAVLAILGIGYYARSYFGLHPVTFMRRNWDSLLPHESGKKTDIHLAVMTAMLWATLLLIGLSNLAAFMLLGVLVISMVLVGRVSSTVREGVLKFLQARRLPVEVTFGLLVSVLAWLVYLFVTDDRALFSPGGEPFSLSNGVSMWPGEAVRVVAGSMALVFMVAGWRSLKEGDRVMTQNFYPSVEQEKLSDSVECASARRVNWCSGKEESEDKGSLDNECAGPFDAKTDWKHYMIYRTLPERWNSVLFPATLFFLLGCVSIYWLDDLHIPYRGEFMHRLDHVVVFGFMVPAFLLLLFAVIDETSLCVGWARRLTRTFTYRVGTDYFLSHPLHGKGDQSKTDVELEEIWTRLQAVARHTRRVGNLIIGPFVVIFLILVSQSPYFDNWDFPVGLVVMIMLSAAYALLCAIKLRKVAEDARRVAIVELTQRLIRCGGKNDGIQLLLSEIRQLKEGGFQPWSQQPWLKAMLWLLSALGIMSAEYISIGALG